MKQNLATKIGQRNAMLRAQKQGAHRSAKNRQRPQLRLIRGGKRNASSAVFCASSALGLPTDRSVVEAAAGSSTAADFRPETQKRWRSRLARVAMAAAVIAVSLLFVL